MAVTPFTMLPLGSPLPPFALEDVVSQTIVDSSSFQDQVVVLAIICNHCPYVRHIFSGLVQFGDWCRQEHVQLIAVSSNDVTTHPEDGPEQMAKEARARGFSFPYVFDASQAVARALRAACTPEFYVFDREHKLAYRGQFDDSRPNNGKPVTGADLRHAVHELLAGRAPGPEQTPSVGCSIKWKRGQAPDYR